MRRIELERRLRGWNQTDLAERVGCTQARVSEWERGLAKPSVDHAVSLAQVLGITVAEVAENAEQRRETP